MIAALCVSGAGVVPARAAEGVALAGKVVSVDGKALIRQDDGQGAAQALKAGDQIKEGDVLNTASNGKVKILLQDMTILDLGSSALFKVQKFQVNHGGDRQVDLSMPYGTVRTSVSKAIAKGGKFQIKTRTATMGVRGTEFIVQADIDTSTGNKGGDGKKGEGGGKGDGKAPAASSTKITVVQGKVEVATPTSSGKDSGDSSRKLASSPPPVMLTAGTQLVATANKPTTKPITLSAADLSAVSTSTKVVDTTFQKAVNLNLSSDGGGGGADSAVGSATRDAVHQFLADNAGNSAPQVQTTFLPPSLPTRPQVVPSGGFSHIHIVVK